MAIASKFNLKQVLDGNKGQNNLSSVLSHARQKIGKDIVAKRTNANLFEYERFLHGIFYPSGVSVISADYLSNELSKTHEEELIKIFEGFDFEENVSGYHSAKKAISEETLAKAIRSAEQSLRLLIDKISKMDSTIDKTQFEIVKQQVDSLIAKANGLIGTANATYFGKSFIESNEAIQVVNQLISFSQVLSSTNGPSLSEMGTLFEKALALTNVVDDMSNTVIDEEVRKLAEGFHTGPHTTQRGVEQGKVSYSISVDVPQDSIANNNFTLSGNNAVFKYEYNPNVSKQGKMDVQLTYKGENQKDYRASAKRWTQGHGSLGETSIDAGITRAAGQSVAEAYKFAILTPPSDQINKEVPSFSAVDIAHDFATLAIKSDIAMGLNQKEGYANILVVDTGSAIKVRDLATIVNNGKLNKYNEGSIKSVANQAYQAIENVKQGRSESYLGIVTSVLNKMRVSMNLSVGKNKT